MFHVRLEPDSLDLVVYVSCLSCFLACSLQPCVHPLDWANLFALSCVMFYCLFVTFPYGVLGQMWYLIKPISDLCSILTLNPLNGILWRTVKTQMKCCPKTKSTFRERYGIYLGEIIAYGPSIYTVDHPEFIVYSLFKIPLDISGREETISSKFGTLPFLFSFIHVQILANKSSK